MKTSGFSLLELLVAIALVGILSAAGLSSFINTQRVARNSKRTADVKAIQGAMESYFSANGSYPAGCNPGATYLPAGVPKDPSTGATYIAPTPPSAANCQATTYCLCSSLEGNTTNGNSTVANCTNFAAGSFFCINELQ